MINRDFRYYPLFQASEENEYGQSTISNEPIGKIKITLNLVSQNNTNNLLYNTATYVGLTTDKTITDKNVISYGEQKLKVLYVNPMGRYNQVFMGVIR